MKATRAWGECQCGCSGKIEPGVDFRIVEGRFFIEGHQPIENTDLLEGSDLADRRTWVEKEIDRIQAVKKAKVIPAHIAVSGTPLFDPAEREARATCQLSLF